MKAEINSENKAKFFAMYWGQNVFEWDYPKHSTRPDLIQPVAGFIENYIECGWLKLKPLSSISDEDASFVCSHHRIVSSDNKWSVNSGIILDGFTTDFLRSRGYAVDWLGLSVDELIEAGWVKIDES